MKGKCPVLSAEKGNDKERQVRGARGGTRAEGLRGFGQIPPWLTRLSWSRGHATGRCDGRSDGASVIKHDGVQTVHARSNHGNRCCRGIDGYQFAGRVGVGRVEVVKSRSAERASAERQGVDRDTQRTVECSDISGETSHAVHGAEGATVRTTREEEDISGRRGDTRPGRAQARITHNRCRARRQIDRDQIVGTLKPAVKRSVRRESNIRYRAGTGIQVPHGRTGAGRLVDGDEKARTHRVHSPGYTVE